MDQSPDEVKLLCSILMFLPSDSQSNFKRIVGAAEMCVEVRSKVVVLRGLGEGAELWKSASREASLTDLMRVVVRGVAAHKKAPIELAPLLLPFAADLFGTSQAFMSELAQSLVDHYHARAVSSYEDVVAAHNNDPLLSALSKLPDDATRDAIVDVAKKNPAKFEPSSLHAHLKRAAEDIPCE